MLAAMQAQHAHFLEQQKGLEARMRLQEERFLQARAPTHVEIIRERIVPTTHVHPVVAQPDNTAEQRAQLAAALSGMHQTLSDHATRHAGDMRETVRGWLNDAHSIWNRPPPAPEAPGVAASSGSPPGPPPPPAGAVSSRGTRVPAGIAAAASSAATHAAPEQTRRRERSRSPARASESRDTVERAARGPAKTARVTKPKAIPPPKPRRYGPQLAPEPAPAPPPPPPPPTPKKKRKVPEDPEAPAPAPRPRAKARAKAMAASLPDHLRRTPDQELPEPPPKRQRAGFDPPPRKRTPKAKARGRTPFVIAAA